MAAHDGTRTIVATPHVNSTFALDPGTLSGRLREVHERLRRERIRIRVLAGGELAHDAVGRLSQTQLEQLAQGPPGHRWLLLEAPFSGPLPPFIEAADEIRRRGFEIVLAHPERSLASVAGGWQAIEREIRAGSWMQINAWSVAGLHGERARIDSLRILRATRRVAVASDAHGPHRAPALPLAVDALKALGEPNPSPLASEVPEVLLAQGLQGGSLALAA
jgi:protein-tyrosine phosphatase